MDQTGKVTARTAKGYATAARRAELVVVNGLIMHVMPLDIAVQLSPLTGTATTAERIQNSVEHQLGLKR